MLRPQPKKRVTPLPDGYRWQWGERGDRADLQHWLVETYREICPDQLHFSHLVQTIEQYWRSPPELLWIQQAQERVACLWWGMAIDQITGDRYPHIFLLRVLPTHRRRGLGTALMSEIQHSSRQQGYAQVGLHVLSQNSGAIAFYRDLGYQPQSILMTQSLRVTNETQTSV